MATKTHYMVQAPIPGLNDEYGQPITGTYGGTYDRADADLLVREASRARGHASLWVSEPGKYTDLLADFRDGVQVGNYEVRA